MPLPTSITDLSTTAASNYPAGSDAPSVMDDAHRALAAFTAQLRDGAGNIASVAAHATTTNFFTARSTTLTGTAVTFTNCTAAPYAGYLARVENRQANVWTDGATFEMQGDANFTAEVGDICWVLAKTTTTFRVFIQKASGQAVTSSTAFTTPANIQSQTPIAFTTGGTSTAYTLTPTPAITANAENLMFWVTFNSTPGASPTLAVSGMAALALKYRDAAGAEQAITSAQIVSGYKTRVVCNAAVNSWIVLDFIISSVSAASETVSGISELATAAEIKTGTDTARTMSPQRLRDAIGYTAYFQSAQQTITAGGALTIAHGLARQPISYLSYIICTTAEAGYSIGDEVPYLGSDGDDSRASLISLVPDATNINVRFGTTLPVVANKGSGAVNVITASSWRLIVRAWA